jgi:phosphoribosylanthranilate isomerase
MLVKICGITRVEDAHAAVAAGAAAIGFVFWRGSPRFIDPYRARAIAATLPPFVTLVGVFVDQPVEYLSGVASLVRLGAVQLHGSETPAYASRLGLPVIKAIAAGAGPAAIEVWDARHTLLLDAVDPVKRGGTGRTVDWDGAASVAAKRPTILAGGLTPENIGRAIGRVRPFGVDVSSGVEKAPGIKDHGRINALFEVIHGTSHAASRS